MDDERSPFASRNIAVHLLRGAIGAISLWYALQLLSKHPVFSLLLGLVTLVAFRGCPMCWTMGLCETAYRGSKKGANTTERGES